MEWEDKYSAQIIVAATELEEASLREKPLSVRRCAVLADLLYEAAAVVANHRVRPKTALEYLESQ